jgi:hypothetical protein
MTGKIIIPPLYIEVNGPIIFLAGPIQGAIDWQKDAINYIKTLNPEINIASPRREIGSEEDFSEKDYNEQVDWEHFYLKKAGKKGVILFWLAKEEKHISGRAYAQTTRFELGEAAATHVFLNIKAVVGIENGFFGARYIRRTLSKKCPGIPICDSLKECCEIALTLITNKT